MLYPANAYLGPRPPLERSPYGYSVLDIGRNVVAPFTLDRVVSPMPDWYAVEGGVTVPDAGGFIVWGTARQAVAEEAIAPMPQLPTQALINGIQAALRELGNRVAALMPPPAPPMPAPIVQMDTGPFVGAVSELRTVLLERVEAAQAAHAAEVGAQVAEMAGSLTRLETMTATLRQLEDAQRQQQALAAIRDTIDLALGGQQRPIRVVNEMNNTALASTLEIIRADMARLSDEVAGAVSGSQADEARRRTVAALDKFLDATGGQQ